MSELPHNISSLQSLSSHHEQIKALFGNLDMEMAEDGNIYNSDDNKTIRSYYRGYSSGDKNRVKYYERRTEDAARLVGGKDVLDVGCGLGTQVLLFAANGAKSVTGIDIDRNFIEIAKKRASVWRANNVSFLHDNFFNVSGQFDVIYAMETIHHIVPFENFFAHAAKLLKPGGKLIIAEPNGGNPFIAWRVRRMKWGTGRLYEINGHTLTNEMYRPAKEVLSHIKRQSFNVDLVKHYRIFPGGSWSMTLLSVTIEPILEKILPMRYFGVGYTIIASKSEKSAGTSNV